MVFPSYTEVQGQHEVLVTLSHSKLDRLGRQLHQLSVCCTNMMTWVESQHSHLKKKWMLGKQRQETPLPQSSVVGQPILMGKLQVLWETLAKKKKKSGRWNLRTMPEVDLCPHKHWHTDMRTHACVPMNTCKHARTYIHTHKQNKKETRSPFATE